MSYTYSALSSVHNMKTKIAIVLAFLAATVLVIGAVASMLPAAALGGPSQTVVYNNIPNPQPGNVPSLGYEATSTSEFGGQVQLDGGANKNPKVTVLMSSWACKSGSWNNQNCITNPGSTFSHPITLNIYEANGDNSPGSLVATSTKTFDMPYRPTADDGTNCNAGNGKAGQWWNGTSCFNGKAFTISFNLDDVTLPDSAIISVAYNTSHYGYAPLGTNACNSTPQGCPYDSLNVGTAPTPSVGEALPTVDDAYLNSTWAGAYCDSGAGGTNVFRLDAGCWTGYLPAFKVEAAGKKSRSNNGHHYGQYKQHGNSESHKHQGQFYHLGND